MSVDLNRILKLHLALLSAAAALCFVLQWAEPASIILGGAVMALNVWLLKFVGQILIGSGGESESPARVGLAVGAFVLHFGLFLAVAAALFMKLPIDGMSFSFGVTVLLIACVIEAVRVGRSGAKGAMGT